MKVLAILDVAPGTDFAALRAELGSELKASWELFSGNILREAYATASQSRVVFVLEAAGADEAGAILRKLPLVAKKMIEFQLIELRPFVNWSMLFRGA